MTATLPRILVFVPMYQCERQIARVLERIDRHLSPWVHEVAVIDNGSRDRSRAAATAALTGLSIPGILLLNDDNYNLGGSHKVAFNHAIAGHFDWVVVVHGDDQADPADLIPLLEAGAFGQDNDALLGSRFSMGSSRSGYAMHRVLGNHVFNLIFTLAAQRMVADLGSGLNAFRVGWLREHRWSNLADDLTFNIHFLLTLIANRARFQYFPISWREEDQVSNVRLLRQAWRTMGMAWGYLIGGKAYLSKAHTVRPPEGYPSTTQYENPRRRSHSATGSTGPR